MISSRVLPHYEAALNSARDASADELCEMFLNQARGMAEYAFLIRDLTADEFGRETQRATVIRANRVARRFAVGAA